MHSNEIAERKEVSNTDCHVLNFKVSLTGICKHTEMLISFQTWDNVCMSNDSQSPWAPILSAYIFASIAAGDGREGTVHIPPPPKKSNRITSRHTMLQTKPIIVYACTKSPMWIIMKYCKLLSVERSDCCVDQLDMHR